MTSGQPCFGHSLLFIYVNKSPRTCIDVPKPRSDTHSRESAFQTALWTSPLETTMHTTHVRPVRAMASAGLVAGLLVALSATAVTTAQAATTRYQAETSPAVCTGTIDSDWTGYSGSGFCNG